MTREDVINNLDWIIMHTTGDKFAVATLSYAKDYVRAWDKFLETYTEENKDKADELRKWLNKIGD